MKNTTSATPVQPVQFANSWLTKQAMNSTSTEPRPVSLTGPAG
jgi:hypothetical protein